MHAREDGQEGCARACGDKREGRAREWEGGLALSPEASLALPQGTWPSAGSTTRYGNPRTEFGTQGQASAEDL